MRTITTILILLLCVLCALAGNRAENIPARQNSETALQAQYTTCMPDKNAATSGQIHSLNQ